MGKATRAGPLETLASAGAGTTPAKDRPPDAAAVGHQGCAPSHPKPGPAHGPLAPRLQNLAATRAKVAGSQLS